jgi:hypothetical protein
LCLNEGVGEARPSSGFALLDIRADSAGFARLDIRQDTTEISRISGLIEEITISIHKISRNVFLKPFLPDIWCQACTGYTAGYPVGCLASGF